MQHSRESGAGAPKQIKVLSVEDNELVGEAIGRKLNGNPEFEWLGWVDNAEALYAAVRERSPDIVCMDLDIPGQNPFEMIRRLQVIAPNARVVILSGHVNPEYVDEAVNAGAWGYLSKAEDSRVIVETFRKIAEGNFVVGRLTDAGWSGHTPHLAGRSAGAPKRPIQPATQDREAGLGIVRRILQRFATRPND